MANNIQLTRQPLSINFSLSMGITNPENMMAKPLPTTISPAAIPRLSLRNQKETNTMIGMLAMPLPMPTQEYKNRINK